MRHFYDVGLPEGATDISTLTFCALVVCGFLTGIGGNGGLTSAINSTAKSFPDRLVRAIALTSCAGSQMLAASNHCWSRHFWLWPICLPILNYSSCNIPRKHLRVSPCTRYRNLSSNDPRILLRAPDTPSPLGLHSPRRDPRRHRRGRRVVVLFPGGISEGEQQSYPFARPSC